MIKAASQISREMINFLKSSIRIIRESYKKIKLDTSLTLYIRINSKQIIQIEIPKGKKNS